METIFLWTNKISNGSKAKRKSLQIIDVINNITKVTDP